MTDYESYALVWQCERVLFGHRQSAQIMSRKRTLDRELINKLRKRVENYGINSHYFSIINQQNCGKESERTYRFDLGPIHINN